MHKPKDKWLLLETLYCNMNSFGFVKYGELGFNHHLKR